MKMQVRRTRPVKTVGRVLEHWIAGIGVALPKGRILIARLAVFRNVQRIRKVLGIYMVQEGDLDRISNTRPQRGAGTRDTMNFGPHGSAEWRRTRVIAREITHPSAIAARRRLSRCRRSQIDLLFIEKLYYGL